MPDVSSKKKSPPPGGRLSSKAKQASSPQIVLVEEIPVYEAADQLANIDAQVMVPVITKPSTPPPPDLMREEPVLSALIIDSYEGQTDEHDFFHGKGHAIFIDGNSYKGAFCHGKMHGHGTYCWRDGTIYVGDFVCNVIVGKGTYSWSDGSIYEGEVVNGLRHGFGTLTSPDKQQSYQGQWLYGLRHGNGLLTYCADGSSYYDGDWVRNEKCGYGVRRYRSGNQYEGEWLNNVRHGNGAMYWYDRGQEYTGSWRNGVQDGLGESVWYLRRIRNSQYPLRNRYVGHFSHGLRHGQGSFYYANGAVYEGEWKNNMKDGEGKFTFKNGAIFTGVFKNDHIVDYPDAVLSGMATPDISACGLTVRSPSPLRSGSVAGDVRDAILDIDIEDLVHLYPFDIDDREQEMNNLVRVALRYISPLKRLYKYYSGLGLESSVDNTFVMSRLQFWRLLKDHKVHHLGYSLIEMDRAMFTGGDIATVHDGDKQMFLRDYLADLIRISHLIFKCEFDDKKSLFSSCLSRLLERLPDVVSSPSFVFSDLRRALEALQYYDECSAIYSYFSSAYPSPPHDLRMRMRDVLYMMRELHLVTEHLTATILVRLLTHESVYDAGYYNLDVEVTSLEVFEVLVESARYFVAGGMLEMEGASGCMDGSVLVCANKEVACDGQTTKDQAIGEDTKQMIPRISVPSEALPLARSGPSPAHAHGTGAEVAEPEPKLVSKPSKKSQLAKDNKKPDDQIVSKSREKLDDNLTEKNAKSSKLLDDGKAKDGKMKAPTITKKSATPDGVELSRVRSDTQSKSNCHLTGKTPCDTPNDVEVKITGTEKPVDSAETANAAATKAGLSAELQHLISITLATPLPIHEPPEDFSTWSRKLQIFFRKHLFPAFHARQNLDLRLSEARKRATER